MRTLRNQPNKTNKVTSFINAHFFFCKLKGPCEPMREKAAILLIENGIDVLVARNDGKRAVEVMNMSDKIRVIVQNATDQGKDLL